MSKKLSTFLFIFIGIFFLFPFVSQAALLWNQSNFSTFISSTPGQAWSSNFTATASGVPEFFQLYVGTTGTVHISIYNYPYTGASPCSGSNSIDITPPNTTGSVISQTIDVGTAFNTCNLVAGTTYYWDIYPNGVGSYSTYGASSGIADAFLQVADSSGFIVDTSTRFISIQPISGSTVSSSSPVTIGAHVYINPADYEAGMYLQMSFTNQTLSYFGGSALDAWNAAFGGGANSMNFPITATSTDFTIATSTTFLENVGDTYGTYKIIKPTFLSSLWFVGGFFSGDTIVASTTKFTIGQQTGVDTVVDQGATALGNYLLTGTTTKPVLNCVNLFSAPALESCLVSLVVPPTSVLKSDFQTFYNGTLSVVPLGYITRFTSIMTMTNSTEPPALSYTFGSSSPTVLQGKTYSVQLFDNFSTLTSIHADDGTNKGIWDIVMPYFNTVVAFAVLFVILEDLLGFRFMKHESDEVYQRDEKLYDNGKEIKVNDYSQVSEQEWQDMKTNRLI